MPKTKPVGDWIAQFIEAETGVEVRPEWKSILDEELAGLHVELDEATARRVYHQTRPQFEELIEHLKEFGRLQRGELPRN